MNVIINIQIIFVLLQKSSSYNYGYPGNYIQYQGMQNSQLGLYYGNDDRSNVFRNSKKKKTRRSSLMDSDSSSVSDLEISPSKLKVDRGAQYSCSGTDLSCPCPCLECYSPRPGCETACLICHPPPSPPLLPLLPPSPMYFQPPHIYPAIQIIIPALQAVQPETTTVKQKLAKIFLETETAKPTETLKTTSQEFRFEEMIVAETMNIETTTQEIMIIPITTQPTITQQETTVEETTKHPSTTVTTTLAIEPTVLDLGSIENDSDDNFDTIESYDESTTQSKTTTCFPNLPLSLRKDKSNELSDTFYTDLDLVADLGLQARRFRGKQQKSWIPKFGIIPIPETMAIKMIAQMEAIKMVEALRKGSKASKRKIA